MPEDSKAVDLKDDLEQASPSGSHHPEYSLHKARD